MILDKGFSESPVKDKWENNQGSEMLIQEVLSPFLDIVFLYKESSTYNYVSGTEEDCEAGWNYFERRFQAVYRGLYQKLYISHATYFKVHRNIEEIHITDHGTYRKFNKEVEGN